MLKAFNKPMSHMLKIQNLLRYQWCSSDHFSCTTKFYKVHEYTSKRKDLCNTASAKESVYDQKLPQYKNQNVNKKTTTTTSKMTKPLPVFSSAKNAISLILVILTLLKLYWDILSIYGNTKASYDSALSWARSAMFKHNSWYPHVTSQLPACFIFKIHFKAT